MDAVVAVVQTRPTPGDVPHNLERALAFVTEAADEGATVVVLPELFATGYDLRHAMRLAEPAAGPVEAALVASARQHDLVIVTALPERVPEGVADTALVIGPGGVILRRRKRRRFADEQKAFLPGEPARATPTPAGTLAPLVCYEVEFPEDARAAALAGATLLTIPAAFTTPRLWDLATRGRAVENGVFLAAANLAAPFCGASRIVAPDGQILISVESREGVAVARCRDRDYDRWRLEHPTLRDASV